MYLFVYFVYFHLLTCVQVQIHLLSTFISVPKALPHLESISTKLNSILNIKQRQKQRKALTSCFKLLELCHFCKKEEKKNVTQEILIYELKSVIQFPFFSAKFKFLPIVIAQLKENSFSFLCFMNYISFIMKHGNTKNLKRL